MKVVSVRELQQDIKRVLQRVERGETIEVTRRRQAIARLSPIRQTARPAPWPDLTKRAREALGKRVISPATSQQVLADRGDW
jgi:prevent-host-death family protein